MVLQAPPRSEDLADLLQDLAIAFTKSGDLHYVENRSGKRFFSASEKLATFAAHAIALHRIRVREGDQSLSYHQAIALCPNLPQQVLARAKLDSFYQWTWLSGQLTEEALRSLQQRIK
jgi:hypothetical protein